MNSLSVSEARVLESIVFSRYLSRASLQLRVWEDEQGMERGKVGMWVVE